MGNETSSNAAYSNTGFDCEFVERPKELQFECSICLFVLRDPQSTSCCGHSFCRGCIERIKARSSSNPICPLCKQKFQTHPHKWLHRALNQLEVYCTHKKEGCEWVGPLGQLDEHLNCDAAETDNLTKGCGFVPLRCQDCNESVPRKGYRVHVTDLCEQRAFSCEYCGDYNSRYLKVVNNHWPKCPCYPVECTNKCGKNVKRKDLHQHLSDKCPLTSVCCEFCSAQVLRGEMREHLMLNLTTHILLMVNPLHERLDKAEEEIRLLTHENQHLRDNVKEEIRKLSHENQCQQGNVKEEIRKLTHENRHLHDDIEKVCLHARKNEEEIRRLREDNLETQSLCSAIRQQNSQLTRKYESLQKEHEDLKEENKELHIRADIASFKLLEKEKKFASSEAIRSYEPILSAAGNTQASGQSAATYYDLGNFGLSQESIALTGYLRDFESPDYQDDRDDSIEGPPVTLIMANYSVYNSGQKSGKYWMSKPFYSGIEPSYKLCLSVRASENLSVFVCLMRGEFDDELDWPFNANITIQLVNHGSGRDWQRKIKFRNGHRVTRGSIASGGRGETNFITLYENSSFVKRNALWFKVVSVQLISNARWH